jgi:hypothetical protein
MVPFALPFLMHKISRKREVASRSETMKTGGQVLIAIVAIVLAQIPLGMMRAKREAQAREAHKRRMDAEIEKLIDKSALDKRVDEILYSRPLGETSKRAGGSTDSRPLGKTPSPGWNYTPPPVPPPSANSEPWHLFEPSETR